VVKDDSEAIDVANDTEYGLVAAIQTGSRDRGRAGAGHLGAGIVHVNDQMLNNDAYALFGGTGASGNGARFGSQSSWDEFSQGRWVTIRDQAQGFPS
jgi:benzaldehyde dehydrogenase (NAD)